MSFKEHLQEARTQFFIQNPDLAASIDGVAHSVMGFGEQWNQKPT